MRWVRRFVKIHRVEIAVAFVLLVAISWETANKLAQPLATQFLVEGDTTAFTFTSLGQTESQSQAGLFASPEVPVDINVMCVKLRRIDSSQLELPCKDGFLEIVHVFVEVVRLGENTRVELLVGDKNLNVKLTPTTGQNSLVTLLFDSKTKVLGTQALPQKDLEREWTITSSDAPIDMTFVNPHFLAADNHGGQRLSPGTAFAFQRGGRSGFVNNTGLLSIAGSSAENRKPLGEDLFQVHSLQLGNIQTLSIANALDGRLSALHVEARGTSSQIQTISRVDEGSTNHALNRAERITGVHISSRLLWTSLLTAPSALLTILLSLYDLYLKMSAVHGRAKNKGSEARN